MTSETTSTTMPALTEILPLLPGATVYASLAYTATPQAQRDRLAELRALFPAAELRRSRNLPNHQVELATRTAEGIEVVVIFGLRDVATATECTHTTTCWTIDGQEV